MKLFALLLAVTISLAIPCVAESPASGGSAASVYSDVPANHWAADAVKQLSDLGVMKGYPDGKFKGDQPITRNELAVALARLVDVLTTKDQKAATKPAALPKPPTVAAEAQKSVKVLKDGKFLPADSPIIKDGSKGVTAKELGDALAAVAARIVELTVPRDPVPQELRVRQGSRCSGVIINWKICVGGESGGELCHGNQHNRE